MPKTNIKSIFVVLQLNCAEGQYSDMSLIFFNTQNQLIHSLFRKGIYAYGTFITSIILFCQRNLTLWVPRAGYCLTKNFHRFGIKFRLAIISFCIKQWADIIGLWHSKAKFNLQQQFWKYLQWFIIVCSFRVQVINVYFPDGPCKLNTSRSADSFSPPLFF